MESKAATQMRVRPTADEPASNNDRPKSQGGRRTTQNATEGRRNPPLISVVTVVYNGVAALRSTIDSVLEQQQVSLEYVVIDGGSTDGTLDLLRDYDSHLEYWISERDKGIYSAMNKALALCTGEYVHFLNAGDRFAAPFTLRRVSLLLELRPTILMNRVRGLMPQGGFEYLPRALGLDTCRRLFSSAYCHQGAFVQSSLLRSIGFDESYRHFADFHTLMRVRRMSGDILETTEIVADFPLDGVSSDWHRAPALYVEKEEVLAALGEPCARWRYWVGYLRAHLYRLKMAIKSR